ncbi:PKD domain-containing protein [Candidatus Woesearchaeota archaeon]|nr:PKD domain-containing protein [Candidatus Woesearchaeota archaeon]
MLKKLVFLIVLIAFASTAMAVSFDFNESKAGKEKQLSGNLILQEGAYSKDSTIKVSINSVSKEKQIQQVINCTSGCEEKSSEYFVYTGATATEINSSNFLTGIRIKKGSTIGIDAKFNISNSDANYPDTPRVDVGNDGIIDWEFQGKSPAVIDWNVNQYKGAEINAADATELNLDSTGTCQQIFLNKSDTFRISSAIKKSITAPPSLGIYIQGIETNLQSCSSLQQTFTEIECTISTSAPINEGDYKICLTAPSAGIVLAVNDSVSNSQGYRCTASSCSKIQNTDYAIKAKSSNFITTLQESLEYFESNTIQEKYFKDAIANFLQACTYQDDFCIIPINVTAKNGNNVKIHDLSYTETLEDGQSYNRNKFLLGVNSQGEKPYYKLSSKAVIPVSKFDLFAPKNLGNYTLKVEYGAEAATANIQVVSAPAAGFNISQQFAPTLTPITFDASSSKSDSKLAYSWDFGDNTTANAKTTTHSYLLPKVYLVKLIVTDENGISDEKTLQVEIFSEKAKTELVQEAISRLQSIKDKLSMPATKEIFESLALGKKIDSSISTLSSSTTLTEEEVNDLINSIPTSITAVNKITITPYLSVEETNKLYGLETESYKATLQELNSRLQKEVAATAVSLSYPNKQESFILVKKTITTPLEIREAIIIELIPTSLASSQDKIEFTDSFPEITRLQDYQSAKFTIPVLKDSFSFSYKLHSNNINSVKDAVLVVIPKELSPSLIPFNCGDGVCNPAEDIISCPEDCREEKVVVSGFPWIPFIVTVILILGLGFAFYKFKLYQKLKLYEVINLLSSRFKKSPFKSGVELAKVRSYIKSALDKGYDEEKIADSLLERGWSRQQVEYAFSKLNSKKQ